MSAFDSESRPKIAAHARLQMDPTAGGAVLLYPEGCLQLNETGHDILRRCDGTNPASAIARELAAEYEASEEGLLDDVQAFLGDLLQRGLIVLA